MAYDDPIDYGAHVTSNNEAHGDDAPPAHTGRKCAKCGNSFQPSADGRIRAFDRDGGAVCEGCK